MSKKLQRKEVDSGEITTPLRVVTPTSGQRGARRIPLVLYVLVGAVLIVMYLEFSRDRLAPLVDSAKTGPILERIQAIQSLGDLEEEGKDALPFVLEAARDEDFRIRTAAANALGQIAPESEDLPSVLVPLLADSSRHVREAALDFFYLSEELPPGFIRHLLPRLSDESSEVRETAARLLVRIDAIPRGFIPEILEKLEDDEKAVRDALEDSLELVVEGDPRFYEPLLAALTTDKDYLKEFALRVLPVFVDRSEDIATAILPLLSDEDFRVRGAAADSLGKLGPKAEIAVEPLLETLLDRSTSVQLASAFALKLIGTEEALHAFNHYVKWVSVELLELLIGADRVTRIRAHDLLFAMRPASYKFLFDGLKSPKATEREAAVYALQHFGSGLVEEYNIHFVRSYLDRDDRVRAFLNQLMGGTGVDRRVIEPLSANLSHPHEHVRLYSIYLLGYIGTAYDSVWRMIKLAERDTLRIRLEAYSALGRTGAEEAVEALVENAKHPNRRIRQAVAEALAEIPDYLPEALPAVVQLFGDTQWQVRAAAVKFFARFREESPMIEQMLFRARADHHYLVRHYAQFASFERDEDFALKWLGRTTE